MEKEEYTTLYNMEDSFWWYVGLRDLVFCCVDKFTSFKGDNFNILDAGCGTGGVLSGLRAYKTYGLDISEEAIKFCKLRKLNNIVQGSICDIPFDNNFFDLIISLDVLYHLSVNDTKALEELHRVLCKSGRLMLNLPAYGFLKSEHDKAVHTRHRYTTKEVKLKLRNSGFSIESITYRNTILFPLALVIRLMKKLLPKNKVKPKSDLILLPNLLNGFLTQILFLENRLILSGFKFPFGLSIFCVAKK